MHGYTCAQLVEDVERGEPIVLNDEELMKVAHAAVAELRQRMPRYAFEQGDLDWEDAGAVQQMTSAEDALDAVETLIEAWSA